MKLIEAWHARGCGLDAVLYQKHVGSTYVDPDAEVAFKYLPSRFASVMSRDFRKEQGRCEDYANLYAMHLLHNLSKYSFQVNGATKLLEINARRIPMAYKEAVALALRDGLADSENLLRGLPAPRKGTVMEEPPNPKPLNKLTDESEGR